MGRTARIRSTCVRESYKIWRADLANCWLTQTTARPAFDCRGSVTIAFAKSSRAITVKLEHTPLHKTVAELAELFKPPPPLPRAEAARRKDGDRRKRKSQADGAEVPEDGAKKKRRKSTKNGERTADGEPAPKPKKPRAPRPKKPQNAGGVQPEADGHNSALLNLSPLETARRHEEASKKLRDSGIDPDTLSAEQFNIFANQSPDLQMESLAMLVKYGAERLRIVHPNKDNTPQSGSPASANGDTPNASTKKKTSRKKAPRDDGAPKVKKTRGSCQACRAKKIKASWRTSSLSHILMLTLSSARKTSRSARSVLGRVSHVISHLNRVASRLRPSLRKWLRTGPTYLRALPCRILCQTHSLLRSLCQRWYQRKKPQTWAHRVLILPILLLLR